jgi:hypothetical protein
MRRKFVLVIVCLSIASVVAVTFSIRSSGKSRTGPQIQDAKAKIQTDNPPPSPRVVYRFLFKHVMSINQKAAELKTQNGSSKGLENFYKNEAALTDREAQVLNEIAADSVREVEEIDARIKEVITAARAHYPEGRLAHKDQTPTPPPELEQLYEQRDAAMTRGYHRLRTEFGEERFRAFDSVVQGRIGANIHPVTPDLRKPGVLPKPQGQNRQLNLIPNKQSDKK